METTSLITQYLGDAARLGEVVRSGGDWSGSSPCAGWSAADVLDHVITTERDFLALHGAATGPTPAGAPTERWEAHLRLLRSVLTEELVTRCFEGWFGPTTVGATLQEFYGWDLLVHRWDLGRALGQEVRLSEEELDRIERYVPRPGDPKHEVFYSDGICASPVEAPPAATRQQRVLATLGRSA